MMAGMIERAENKQRRETLIEVLGVVEETVSKCTTAEEMARLIRAELRRKLREIEQQ